MKPRICLIGLFFLMAAVSVRATSYTWNNTSGGSWGTAGNWTPNGIPGSTDSAAITATGNYTVIVGGAESIGTLTLGASTADGTVQTLTVSSTLTVNNSSSGTAQGTLSVTGGTLTGGGSILLAGKFNWTAGIIELPVQFANGTVGPLSTKLLEGGQLINTGTMAWNDTIFTGGSSTPTLISNVLGGTITLAAGIGTQNQGDTRTIANNGTFTMTGTGTSTLGDIFNNNGTVTTSGTLNLGGGGTENGSFTIPANSTLNIDGGTAGFNSGSTISGAGNFTIGGGTANLGGTLGIGGTYTFSGGTANFTGSAYTINGPVNISGAAVNVNGTGTFTPTDLDMSSGALGGSGTVTVSDTFTWTSGTIKSPVQFANGTVGTGSTKLLQGGQLINTGTMAWDDTIFTGGSVTPTLISNALGGTITLAAGIGTENQGDTRTIANNGTFTMTGTGTSTLGDVFNNNGAVTVSGTLVLSGGGTETGSFTIPATSTLNLNGGTFGFGSDSTISGVGNFIVSGGIANLGGTFGVAGTYTFSGGTANLTGSAYTVNGTINISGATVNVNGTGTFAPTVLDISGGTLGGSNPVTVSGTFTWTAGTIQVPVQFVNGTVGTGSTKLLQGGQLINTGTMAWNDTIFTGGSSNPTLISNLVGATITLVSGIGTENQGDSRTIANNGTITMTGTGTTTLGDIFNNNGTVTVSGTLSLNGGGTETGLFTVLANSTNILTSSTFSFSSGSSITGAGVFNVSGATANFTGTSTLTPSRVNLTSGTLNFNNSGALTFALFNMSGGTLEGSNPVLISGTFDWTAGTIIETVEINGAMTVGTGSTKLLQGGQLINAGTMAWNDTVFTGGSSTPTLISNLLGSTITLAAGIGTQNQGDTRTIANNGTITMTGTGTSTFNDTFNNNGTVTISGTLSLNGGGTETGLFTVPANSTNILASSTFSFNSGSSITGAGVFTVSGSTANFTGTSTLTPSQANLISGTLNFNNSGTLTLAIFDMSGGTLEGSNPVLISGTFNWTAGTIIETVDINGAMTVGTGSTKLLQGGQLINAGTVAWNDTIFTGGSSTPTLISNVLGGTITLTAGIGTESQGDTRTIANNGTITMTGTGTSTFNDIFNNNGTVTISGTLSLNGGGTETGLFTVPANSTNILTSSTFSFNSGSSITGAGVFTVSGSTANFTGTSTLTPSQVNLTGGILNFNNSGALAFALFNMSGGILEGSNPVLISGTFNWTAGSITATVENNGAMTVGTGSTKFLQGGQVINAGTMAWNDTIFTGGSVTPTLISNVLGGTITVTAGIGTESQGNTRTIANNGTFTVAGTGTSTFNDTFNNTGTLNAQSGTTSLTGSYSLTSGTLNFGLTSLSSFGEITLTGAAKLTGGLSANLNPSFSPIIGDSWQVLNYGSQTGIFTKTNLPPTAVWQTTYNAANTTIKILQFVPTITWATPAPIVYGTTLSGLLNATAASPYPTSAALTGSGTFTYTLLPSGTPISAGTILNASNQTLSVVFTPSAPDQVNFSKATNTVNIDVLPLPVVLNGTRIYDGTTNAASTILTIGNIVSSDVVTVASGDGGLASSNAISEAITSVGTLTLGGAQAPNYTLTGASGSVLITPKALTMSGLSVPLSKPYDGTTTAAVSGSPGSLQSAEADGIGSTSDGKPYTGDLVSLTGTAIGIYNSKDVATASSVIFGGLSLSGAQANNYTLTIQSPASASIAAKILTMSGLSVPSSKIYDGTTIAAVSGSPGLLQSAEADGAGSAADGKPYIGDAVSLTGAATGTYNSKDAATASTVTFAGVSLNGAQASDYTLTIQGPASAAIAGKALTMSGLSVPSSKVYDGTTTAAVSGSPGSLQSPEADGTGSTGDGRPYVGDTVSLTGTAIGTYNSKDVATAATVTFNGVSLTGTQAGDYTLTVQSPASATITAKGLTMSGLSVPASKVYDGTTTAAVSGSPGSLQSVEANGTGSTSDGKPYIGDTVSLTGTATGTYNSKDVTAASTVTFAGVSLAGAQESDYTLTVQSPAAATITAKTLTMSGLSVPSSKIYDGTTTATVSGSPGLLQLPESGGTGSASDGKPYVGDTVSLTGTATGTYNSKDVATASTVTFGGVSLTGTQAGDYTLTIQSSAGATITTKGLTMSGLSVPSSKVYDGTTTAVVSGSPGALQLPETGGTGSTGDGKPYVGDAVSLTGTATGTYNSKNVLTATTVTFAGVSLTGTQAGDYALTIQSPTAATISAANLSITADNESKITGQTLNLGTTAFTTVGLASGDAVTGVTLTSAGAASSASAGGYPIVPSSAVGTGLANYTIAYLNGTLTVSSSNCDPPPSGLVSWWKAEGNAIDNIGGNNGTIENGVTYVSGEVGKAFSFNSDSAMVVVGSPANLQLQDFTIEAWVQRGSTTAVSSDSTAVDGNALLFGYGTQGYGFGMTSSGNLLLTQIDASGVSSTVSITDTTFHHVVVTKSGGTIVFYVDGVADPLGTSYNPTFAFTKQAAIGGRADNLNANNNDSFLGLIDEMSIYSRALTGTEVTGIFNAGSAGKCIQALEVTWGTPSDIVYGTALSGVQLDATANVPGTFNYSPPLGTVLPAGQNQTLSVTFSPSDTGDYSPVVHTVFINVDQAPLVITAGPQSKTYGAVLNLGTTDFTTTVLSNSDTVTGVTLTSPGAVGTAGVGGYFITPSAAVGTGLANYNITYDTGALTVTAAPLMITAGPQFKTYGVVLNLGTTVFTTTVLSNSDTVAGVTLASPGAAGTAAVGGYLITPSLAVGTGLGNYNITYDTGSLTVTVAPLNVTAGSQSKTYGAVLNLGTTDFTTSSLFNGDAVASVTLASPGAVGTAGVGGYLITPSAAVGTGLANYSITYDTGPLAVTAAPLTITATAQSKTYGTVLNLGTTAFTTTVLSNSDSVSGATLSSPGAVGMAAVGGYSITPSAAVGTGLANYNITYDTGALTVTAATLTITASPQSKTFGTTLNLGTTAFTTTVLSNSDTVTGVTLTSPGAASTATDGGYPITPSAAVGTGLGNYDIFYQTGTLTVSSSTAGASITCPDTITVNQATGECSQLVAFAPVVTGTPTPTVVFELDGNPITSPFNFPVGTNTVHCTASNPTATDSCSFTVIVVDTNPPVAGLNSLGTYQSQTASVAVDKVLLRDTAPSGGTLSIPSVSAMTLSGGTASLAGGLITYSPPASLVGPDSIAYTLSDGCGTTQGTIAVIVLATNLPANNRVSIAQTELGTTVIFAGVPGATYQIQSALTVSGPWGNIGNPIQAAANGLVQYTDTTSSSPTQFYRTQFVSGP